MTGLRCPNCGFYNLSARTKCARCGKPLPEISEEQKPQSLFEDEQSSATGSGSISKSEPGAKTGSGSMPRPEPPADAAPASTITGEVVADSGEPLEAVIEQSAPEAQPAGPGQEEPEKIKPTVPEMPSFDDSAASRVSTEAELGELSEFFKEARKKPQAAPAAPGEPKPSAREVSKPSPGRGREPLVNKERPAEEASEVRMEAGPERAEDSMSQIRIQSGETSHPSDFKPNFDQPLFPDLEAEAAAEARSDSDSAVSRPLNAGILTVALAGFIDLAVYFVMAAAFSLAGSLASGAELNLANGPENFGPIVPVLIVLLVVIWFYQMFFLSVLGQTPGQIAAGIQALDKSGTRPSLAKAGIRAFVYLLCLIPAGIGFIPNLIGISIPDKIANTKIVRW